MTKVGNVMILDAWARASHDVSNNSAVYMTLEMTGDQPDYLLAAETPAAEKAELHTYWLEGCFVHRHPVEAIELSAGQRTLLGPGGLHIMLMGLQQELVEGRTIPLTLTFEKAGTVEIEVPGTRRPRWDAMGGKSGQGGRRWPVGEHASVAFRPGAVQPVESGSGYQRISAKMRTLDWIYLNR